MCDHILQCPALQLVNHESDGTKGNCFLVTCKFAKHANNFSDFVHFLMTYSFAICRGCQTLTVRAHVTFNYLIGIMIFKIDTHGLGLIARDHVNIVT